MFDWLPWSEPALFALVAALATAPGVVPAAEHATLLTPGATHSRPLAAGAEHVYEIDAAAGDVLALELRKQGICVFMDVANPDGSRLFEINENGANGSVAVRLIAGHDGRHRVTARPCDEDPEAGTYRLALVERRPATETDRQAFRAHLAEARANAAVADGTAPAWHE